MAGSNYRPPCAEDCLSDDGENTNANNGISIDSFVETSPGKANVRTKRSNPEHLGTEKTPTGKAPTYDVKSDSGYSSQSVAGMSSADSAASAASSSSQRSPLATPAAPSPTPQSRAPRPSHQRRESTQSAQSAQPAARQPLSRRDSQASRRPATERRPTITREQAPAPRRRDSRNVDDPVCTKPGCTTCGPDAVGRPSKSRTSRRLSMLQHPAESAPNVSQRNAQDTRSQVSDPATYHPPSPVDGRPTRLYHSQGGPVVQPAMSRRPSVSRPSRPISYHGDPRDSYRPRPTVDQVHGPPPSMPVAFNYPPPHLQHPQHPMAHGYMAPPYGSSNPYFDQARQMHPHTPQAYEASRPPPPSARAPNMTSRAPVVVPVMTQPAGGRDRPNPARYSSYTAAPQYPPQRQIQYEQEEDSETESESDSEQEYEHPPRAVRRIRDSAETTVPQRRPSMHHANTTPVLDRAHRKPRPQTVVVDRPSRRDPERERALRAEHRKSISRPPVVPHIKSQSEYVTPRGQIIVESPRSDRRSRQEYNMSFGGRERASRREYNAEPKRHNRNSRVFESGRDFEREYDDEDDDEDDEVDVRAPLSRARRGTNTDHRPRNQRPVAEVHRKVNDAENYINADRGTRETYADQAYDMARNRSSGGPSEAGSSRSKGSDKTNGEIRLLIANDAPVTLRLNGEMEGRSIRVEPGEDGTNELVISGNRETAYRSERDSFRRAITSASQAGRDAEEMERSSQSSRRRRATREEQDEPRRVLHSRRPRTDRRGEAEYRR